MEVVLNAAIGYQALHLPHPKDALHDAQQQVTKVWAQHGGAPGPFPKEIVMAHWRYYRGNTGALVDTACAKHAAHLLYRVTHSHQPEVREAATICIMAQRLPLVHTGTARYPYFRVHQHLGPATTTSTAPHTRHPDEPPLRSAGATCVHRHPAGELDTLRLMGATSTIVHITPTQMRVMAQSGAYHAPFLSDRQWPASRVFQANLRACATKPGQTMPGPKDIGTAYKASNTSTLFPA